MIKTELLYQPSFSLAKVQMDQGDELRVEAGAMVSMNSKVQIETNATGGMMKSLRRSAAQRFRNVPGLTTVILSP